MISWFKCLVGWHDWRIANEVSVPGTGFTDNPADFESGGVDYIIRCAHCPSSFVKRGRGFWIKPEYPAFSKDSQTVQERT